MRLYCKNCKAWRDENSFFDRWDTNREREYCRLCSDRPTKKRPLKNKNKKIRKCLSCDKEFISENEMRICPICKSRKNLEFIAIY